MPEPRRGRRFVRTAVVITIIVVILAGVGLFVLNTRDSGDTISAACRAAYASVTAHPAPAVSQSTALAPTPPMGFSSYPNFGTEVDEGQIRGIVDAMYADGLEKAQYEYINVDDGWQGPRKNGVLTTSSRFPCGMELLGEYIHAHGFKFGLYTTPGATSCGGYPGSEGHITTDVDTFASWGVDAIKLDWCAGDYVHAKAITQAWRTAINQSGRQMLLSINLGGNPWTGYWAKNYAQTWRTSDDICPSWYNKTRPHAKGATACYGTKYQSGVYDYLTTSNTQLNAPNVGPGHWADPDSLEAGNTGLTYAEAQTQFSIWSMWSAPLILGCDPRQISKQNLKMLTNPEVIAIDQDRLGNMAKRLKETRYEQLWVKKLSGNAVAVAIVNLSDSAQVLTVDWQKLGIAPLAIRDLWARAALPVHGTLTYKLPAHGTALLRVKL